jgi:hypothetical protein
LVGLVSFVVASSLGVLLVLLVRPAAGERKCWAPHRMRPMCQAMLTHEYTYADAAVDACTPELDSSILPQVNTGCMQLFLNEFSKRHPDEPIVMVLDGAGWHQSGMLKAPDNICLLRALL